MGSQDPGDPVRRSHCPVCGKTSFTDKADAHGFMNSLRRRAYSRGSRRSISRSDQLPKRAYECPAGNGWHVTRQDDYRKGGRR